MAKKFDWSSSPVDVVPNFEKYLEHTEKERTEAIRAYETLPYASGFTSEEDLRGYNMHMQDDKIVKGTMTYDAAAWSSMAMDYAGGMWAENAAHQKEMADNMMNLWNAKLYENTMMDLSMDQKVLLDEAYHMSPWNIANLASPKVLETAVPFFSSFDDDITDVRDDPAPEGWTPEIGLELIKLKDTNKYLLYVQQLGGEERMKELVKDTNNPADLFITLSEAFKMENIITSTARFYEENAWYTTLYTQGKHLIVNGVINDPDLVPEMVAGGVISGATVGVGSLIMAPLWGAKRIAKGISTGVEMSNRLARLSRLGKQGISLLPSNIGSTVMKKAMAKRYAKAGKYKKFFVYDRIGDMGEGVVTGFLAEWGNQTRKINDGIQSDYDWSVLGSETLLEMALSPVINPIIGGSFFQLQKLASMPLGLGVRKQQEAAMEGGFFGGFYTKLKKWNDPVAIEAATQELLLHKDFVNLANQKLGVDYQVKLKDTFKESSEDIDVMSDSNKEFGSYLAMLSTHFDMTPKETMQAALVAIKNVEETGLRPIQLAHLVGHQMLKDQLSNIKRVGGKTVRRAKRKAKKDVFIDEFNSVLTWMNHRDMMHKEALNHKDADGNPDPMSYTAYTDMIIETEQHELLLPPDVREQAETEAGDAWATMDSTQRFEAGEKIQQDIVKKIMNQVDESSARIDELNEEVKNLAPGSDSSIIVSNAATGAAETGALFEGIDPKDTTTTATPEPTTPARAPKSPFDGSGTDIVQDAIGKAQADQGKVEEDINTNNRHIEKLKAEIDAEKKAGRTPAPDLITQLKALQVTGEGHRGKINTVRNYLKALKDIEKKIKAEIANTHIGQGGSPEFQVIQETLKDLNKQALSIEVDLDSRLNSDNIPGIQQLQDFNDQTIDVITSFNMDLSGPNGFDQDTKNPKIKLRDLSNETIMNLQNLRDSAKSMADIRGLKYTDIELIQFIDTLIGKSDRHLDLPLWSLDVVEQKKKTSLQEFNEQVVQRAMNDHKLIRGKQEKHSYFIHYTGVAKEVQTILLKRDRLISSFRISEEQQARSILNVIQTNRDLIERRRELAQNLDTQQNKIAAPLIQRAKDNKNKPIINDELIKMLPRSSEVRKNMEQKLKTLDARASEEYLNTELRIKKVEKILAEEYRKAMKNIRSRTGMGQDPDADYRPYALAHKRGVDIYQLTDEDYSFLISNGHDTVLAKHKEHLDSGGILKVKRSREDEAIAWREVAMRMSTQELAEGDIKGITGGAVRAALPDHWRSSDGLGMAEFVFFKEAIMGEFEGVVDNTILALNQEKLMYHPERVREIATQYQYAAMKSKKDSIDASMFNKNLKATNEALLDPRKAGQGFDIERSYRFIEELMIAEQPENIRMFESEGWGWVLDTDHRGMPDQNTAQATERDWLTKTREAFINRLKDNRVLVNPKKFAALYESIGRTSLANSFSEDIKIVTTEHLDQFVDLFFESGIKAINDQWNVRDFGNGILDWRPATTVGETLADVVSGKPITKGFGISMVENMDISGLSEDLPAGGPSRKVIFPPIGQGSRIGLVSPVSVLQIVKDYSHRARIKAVLALVRQGPNGPVVDITPAQMRSRDKQRETTKTFDSGEDIGEGTRIEVIPPLIFGHGDEITPTRDMQKEALTYFLRDIPNTAISTIQDMSVIGTTHGLTLRGAATGSGPMLGGVSQGGPSKVPYNLTGELYSMEMGIPKMNRLTDSLIQAVANDGKKIREEFAAKWPVERIEERLRNKTPDWDSKSENWKQTAIRTESLKMLQRELYEPDNYSDRLNSGIFEMRLLALAAANSGTLNALLMEQLEEDVAFQSEKVKIDIGDGTIEEHSIYDAINKFGIEAVILQSEYGTEAEYDFYKKTGGLVARALNDPKNKTESIISELGDLDQLLREGKHFDAEVTFGEPPNEVVTTALRALYKPPVMRKVYQGGMKNFIKEFITDSDGDGRKALNALIKAWEKSHTGVKLNITNDNIMAWGKILYKNLLGQKVPLIQQGVGVSTTMQKAVQLYMQIDLPNTFDILTSEVRSQNEIIESLSLLRGDKAGTEFTVEDENGNKTTVTGETTLPTQLSEESKYITIENAKNNLEDQVSRIAAKEGMIPSEERARYAPSLDEAYAYMEENGEMIDGELAIDVEHIENLNKILVPVDGLSAVDIGHINGLNQMISSAYVINRERITMVAKSLGLKTFDIDDFMGLDNMMQYHRFGTSSTVTRGFFSGRPGLNYQGTSLGRVATTPKGEGVEGFPTFEAFMADRNPQTDEEYVLALNFFLEAHEDNSKALGMYDLVDSPYAGWSDKKFDKYIEKMMYVQELLWEAGHSKSPKFLKNTVDDLSTIDLKAEAMKDWRETSEKIGKKLDEEEQFESLLLNLGDEASSVAKLRARSRGAISERYAAAIPEAERVSYKRKETNRKQSSNIRTSHDTGPHALTPLKSKISWGDRGMPVIQAHMLKELLGEKLGAFDRINRGIQAGHEGMVGYNKDGTSSHEGFGWTSVYDDSRLPSYPPMVSDPMDTYGPGAIPRRAAQLEVELRAYAEKVGEIITNDPMLYIDLYLRKRVTDIQNEMMMYVPRSEEEYRQKRAQWHEKLWNITKTSYEMKYNTTHSQTLFEKSRQISIDNPLAGSKEAVLRRLLNDEFSKTPPLIGAALLAGPMPIEGVVLHNVSNDEFAKAVRFGRVEIKGTTANASIPQSKELGGFIVSKLLESETALILKGDPSKGIPPWKNSNGVEVGMQDLHNDRGETIKVWQDPKSWQELVGTVEDLQDLRRRATDSMTGAKGTSIDLVLDTTGNWTSTEIDPDTGNEMVTLNANIKHAIRYGMDGGTRYNFRNPHAMVGLGFQIRVPRNIIGKEFSVGLTRESMDQVFTQIQNLQTIDDIAKATQTNTQIRVLRSEVESMTQTVGYSMAPSIQADKLDSDALLTILRRIDPNIEVSMVTDRATTGGSQSSSVIDMDHYMRFNRPTMLWRQALVDPIRDIFKRVNSVRVQDSVLLIINNIQRDIDIFLKADDAAKSNYTLEETIEAKLRLTFLSQMFSQNTDSLSSKNIELLLPPEMRDTKTEDGDESKYAVENRNAEEQARSWWRTLNSVTSEKSMRRTNPWYYITRSYMWTRLNEKAPNFGPLHSPEDLPSSIITDIIRDEAILGNRSDRNSLSSRIDRYAHIDENFVQYRDTPEIWGVETELGNIITPEVLAAREEVMVRSAELYAEVDNLAVTESEHAAKTIVENLDEDQTLFKDERRNIAENNYAKSHKKMSEYAESKAAPMEADINRLNDQVSELVTAGVFDETQAKIARDMLLNVFAHNPMMLQDLDLGRWTNPEDAAISVEEDGKVVYKIRIGDKLRTVADNKFTALLILAHELSHVGFMKFVSEGSREYKQFTALLHNPTAKENLKNLIISWHGGQFTTEAEAEYNSYLENPEEFIAALGSFYLLKGSLPEVKSWAVDPTDPDGSNFLRAAHHLVRRGFAYVRDIFESLATVWGGMSHVKEYDDLMKTLFGWDLENNKPMSKTLGEARGTYNFGMMERVPF